MQRFFKATFALLAAALLAGTGRAAVITIGSYEAPRANAAFTNNPGALGYSQLQRSLADPAKFGPQGIVPCEVFIAPPTQVLTDDYLADKDVFITGLFTGEISVSEEAAIAAFVNRGGVVITDCDSDLPSQAAASSILSGIGTSARTLGRLVCPNSASGGNIEAGLNQASDGPFGNITGQKFSVSMLASVLLDGRDKLLVTCSGRVDNVRAFFPKGALSANSGIVMFGGDPSGTDFFTQPGQTLYNENNEILYLNVIATACGAAGSCPFTKNFWRENPELWPVTSLTLGCESYEKEELLDLLTPATGGDASLLLAQELIAQKLSVANGTDPAPIVEKSARADEALCRFSGRLPFGVTGGPPGGRRPSGGGPGLGRTRTSGLASAARATDLLAIAGSLRSFNHRKLTRNCQSAAAR